MVDPGDDLESTVEHLRDRVDDLESQLDQESQSPATATRRDALKAGGAGALLGALGLGSITSGASADPQGRLGSASDPVQQAYINEADVTALSAEQASISQVSARAYQESATGQSIASGSVEPVTLDASEFVDADIFAFDNANDEIDITVDGTFLLTGLVAWDGIPDGTLANTVLQVDGSTVASGRSVTGNSAAFPATPAISLEQITAPATINLAAFQNSGSSQSINSGKDSVWIGVARLG